jgi:hypothetical protein
MLSSACLAYRALTFLRMRVAVGVVGVLSHKLRQRHNDTDKSLKRSLALRQFQTSSLWPVPRDYQGAAWTIRNDYPQRKADHKRPSLYSGGQVASSGPPSDGPRDMPWSMVDFKVNPLAFCEVVKQYCWEGNVENRFVVQRNHVRSAYRSIY